MSPSATCFSSFSMLRSYDVSSRCLICRPPDDSTRFPSIGGTSSRIESIPPVHKNMFNTSPGLREKYIFFFRFKVRDNDDANLDTSLTYTSCFSRGKYRRCFHGDWKCVTNAPHFSNLRWAKQPVARSPCISF